MDAKEILEDVLILVLVEDGLGATQSAAKAGDVLDRLNPCFSGGWSRSWEGIFFQSPRSSSLNPCFSGGWSRRGLHSTHSSLLGRVLILVLVEDGLGGAKLLLPDAQRRES